MAGKGTEQGGLAAAGRAEYADEFAGFDGEAQGLHGLEGVAAAAEVDRQAVDAHAPRCAGGQAHGLPPAWRCQGVTRLPSWRTSRLLAMPSTPISSMPTTMSG